ncbi:MAG: ECF transporter S component [Oscillospiraceae bacterium]|nr:ECF transporter S component [Oscillospiraceae bacterium]
MKRPKKAIKRFKARDLILTAAMAATGIAVKAVFSPFVRLISAPLLIPGGALAGGLYMMWLIMAAGLTGKRGAASLAGLIQALLVIAAGAGGSHGLLSLVSYTLPGLAADAVFLLMRRRATDLPGCVVSCSAANLCGTVAVNLIFFRLPLIPLLLGLTAAAFSGGTGGVLAWHLLRALRRFDIIAEN